MFFWPQCTFGTKNPKNPNTGTPSKIVLFQKKWRKRVKEYSFNLSTERDIVEDCVAVILPPQLTLSDWFCNFNNFFPEPTLLSQNSNSGVLAVYWAYIWLRFIKWNAKALTHVVGEMRKCVVTQKGCTCVRAFAFHWWIEAKYKPSTQQELRYLNFDLWYLLISEAFGAIWMHYNSDI